MINTDLLKKLIAGTGHCSTGGCNGCPYDHHSGKCLQSMMHDLHTFLTELMKWTDEADRHS